MKVAGRRALWIFASFGLLAALAVSPASAQEYPAKAVRMIVPFAPGGGADFFGRLLAEKLAPRLGQAVVIENRGGAGGSVGAEIAAKAAPDGYTLVFVSNGFSVSPAVSKVAYDPMKDFAPVARVVDTSMVVAVHPAVPATTRFSAVRTTTRSTDKPAMTRSPATTATTRSRAETATTRCMANRGATP